MQLRHFHQDTPQWRIDILRKVFRSTFGFVSDMSLDLGYHEGIRAVFRLLGKVGTIRADVIPETIAGIHSEWLVSPDFDEAFGPIILYSHGGGFVFGSTESHRPIASDLAMACDGKALVYNYRLAPEHPYPAALEDAIVVYSELLDQGINPEQIVLAGDSAGGALSLAMLLACRDKDLPQPRAAILICPWADFLGRYPSLNTNRDILLTPKAVAGLAKGTFRSVEDKQKFTLIDRDLNGLPPILLQTGSDDVLFSEAVELHHRLAAAGNCGESEIWQNMPHVWHGFSTIMPEGKQALLQAGEFARKWVRDQI